MLTSYPGAAIARIPKLFGPSDNLLESPVTTVLNSIVKSISKGEQAAIDNWQERSYISVYSRRRQKILAFVSKYHLGRVVSSKEEVSAIFGGVFH